MPKVINQTGVSIDSLQAKLMLLESKFSKLSVEHKLIQDSLKSLDKTLHKAEIATTFYDTHLATYTAIFGLIVTILLACATLINWIGLMKPQEKKFNKLVNALQENLDYFKRDYIDEIVDDLKEVSARSMQTVSIAHEVTNPDVSFIFSVRLLKLMCNWDKKNEKQYKTWMGYTEDFLDQSEFPYKDIEEGIYEEMVESLTSVIQNTDDVEDKSKINRILSKYMSTMEAIKAEHDSQTKLDLQESDEETQPSQD